jgi:hypothetical protein
MNRIYTFIVSLLTFLLLGSGIFYGAFADHGDHKEGRKHQKRERRHAEHNDKRDLASVTNATYKENCGACHFAYQPGLLPSGSWEKILNSLSDHFGEAVEIDPESVKTISEYLKACAADRSSAKLSRKIMKSIGSQTPVRITQVPYIRREHHEIHPELFERKAIGSFSNCTACHTSAEKGIYDDDDVNIPK